MSILDRYREMLRDQIASTGRPENPALRDLDLDPSARPFVKEDGDVITAEERTLMARGGYHAVEGLHATLTPLAMFCQVDAMLTFLTCEPDEDPWGEASDAIDNVARDELGRAHWHLHEAWKHLGWPTGERA